MLENKKVKTIYGEVYYSRFIASWEQVKGSTYGCFEIWLESLVEKGIAELTEQDIRDINEMRAMGKLELECNVREFISKCVKCDGAPCLCEE